MFFTDEPLQLKKGRQTALRALPYVAPERRFASDFDIMSFAPGSGVVCDTETFWNYGLIAFKHLDSQTYFYEEYPFNIERLNYILFKFRIIGFNFKPYDLPLIAQASRGASISQLKELSDSIILRGEQVKAPFLPINNIDLIEVAPLQGSLKLYAARLHAPTIQELPVDPHSELTEQEKIDVRNYCFNDLDCTELLFNELKPQIILREQLGAEYGQDLRSKSDAQIAEAVLNSELKRINGRWPTKGEPEEGYSFRYQVPTWLRFQTEPLQRALAAIEGATFRLQPNGSPALPAEIEALSIAMGSSIYRLGIGGLHSTEKSAAHLPAEGERLLDRDVASYYPFIILNLGLYPKHLGPSFLKVYRTIVERRLEAKRQGNKTVSETLKIVINGSFGKLGQPFSTLYSPDLLIQVTVTGQLALLMLIEAFEHVGISVVSGNTDGIVFRCRKEQEPLAAQIVEWWQRETGFETEETEYKATFSRDVNNYIAVKLDGSVKHKGVYSERGSALNSKLSKNPETLILADAVSAFLTKGTPVAETIRNCRDIKRFLAVRNVKGGAHKGGIYLGKVVRWYYAEGERGAIEYVLTGNKVPKSDGAKPLMQLGEFPSDIDYAWYEREATEMLYDLGYFQRAKQLTFF